MLSHFVQACDEWRQWLGLNHTEFAERLGRTAPEWRHYRNGRRTYPSRAFARAARALAEQSGGPWVRVLDDAIRQDAVTRATGREAS